MQDIIEVIKKEVAYAESKFPGYNSMHEGYAVIKEEVDELWDEVKEHSQDHKLAFEEAKQIACTAIRFMKMLQRMDNEL